MRVRQKAEINQWLKFFLVGIIETAQNGIITFDNILKLKTVAERKIQTLGSSSANAQKVLDYLYQRPIIDAAKISEVVRISAAASYKLIVELERFKILHEITGGKSGRLYGFDDYVKLFR